MPIETKDAVTWALQYEETDEFGMVFKASEQPSLLVDKVRDYFNTHKVQYSTFSYDDLIPFFN